MNNKPKSIVRKSNIFIEGRYRFGLHEQKILLMIVSKIKTDQKEFTPYKILWGELKKISKGFLNSTSKINKACESLKNKTISIKKGDTVDNFGFLSGWKTHQGKYVEFRIDPGMKEMLLGLLNEGHFTLYDLEFALALPSAHAVRMYEILKNHSWKKQPVVILLDDLKNSLDISLKSATYKDFGNFRRYILESSKKNLSKYTDISFTYTTIKEGRKVISLSFRIKENKKYQKTIQAETNREFIKPGDKILIDGQECTVDGSGCYYQKKHMPLGYLTTMLKKGQIELLKG